MPDLEVSVAGRCVMVRDGGDPDGVPVVHLHGTPGSRVEADPGAAVGARTGVRVIGFDRPGYGRSDPAPTTLRLVAHDVEAIADRLGLSEVAVLGWSGGGPFALAAAAVLGDRVTRVGVSGGLAPVQQMPRALDALDDNDRRALSFLPADPVRAAEQFRTGNAELLDAMMSVREDPDAPWIDWMWGTSDPEVVADADARRALLVSFREALRQGTMAIAWDNVAFVGPWGIRLEDVGCPVHLWYGDRDQMAPPANGEWLAAHLPDAELVLLEGEGHLVPLRHWAEMLHALTRPR
ncbi:alpha/beta fold hydrolase [Nocardioides sp. zg-DK7169]|uniref:alpha/beta fold hydrolase n=1 Tax=Nocardioides sp. zg-DK7169 TaxID=2736600 RepID=UPI00155349C8|nr:alpha/beta hydrolase [Nocardioides sp. zg-DK7169]NPC95427.1 alpha/beta hydrolase [Nocardioides sp. zg-DK7169]